MSTDDQQPRPSTPDWVDPHAEEPRPPIFVDGEMLNDVYEVRILLGEGGMGQVYEAHDHLLNRRVAIKAPWPDSPGDALRNEARALAAFRHPSLVTVHTIGIHRGTDYIVMERIYGVSLADDMTRRTTSGAPFSIPEALDILIRLADGLSVVHRAGIAHRDVKPGNIMLTPDHRVVLMDFGLFLPEFEMNTQNTIAGSPPYMAPEALTNTMEPGGGHLLDIYSLGVIAYELLTDRLPREGATLKQLYLEAKNSANVPKASRWRRDTPKGLDDLIVDMLAAEPEDRPQSAEAVVWGLKGVRDGRFSSAASKSVAPEEPPGIRLLIVDDDPDIAKVLTFYIKGELGPADVKVDVVGDGEQALTYLRRSTPDMVLLDLHMPRMNGIELAMYIRGEQLAQDCPIIAVSAGAQPDDVQVLHELGIRHVIQKGSGLRERLSAALLGHFGSVNERHTVRPPSE